MHGVPYRELAQLMVLDAQGSRGRWEAEQREHGLERQPDGMPLASVGETYTPDAAWQRALAEKRRLLASRPRSN